MKFNFLILSIIVLTSSCYNYDGPTRPKKEIANKEYDSTPSKNINTEKEALIIDGQQVSSKKYIETLAAAIKRTLPSAQVKLLQDSILVLFPDNILYRSSNILPIKDVNYEMSKLAELFIKYDKTSVLVSGHTDNTGTKNINKHISEMRAQYIANLLKYYKVPTERINYWGLGGSSPIASTKVKGSLEKNRRVEFIVLSTIQED